MNLSTVSPTRVSETENVPNPMESLLANSWWVIALRGLLAIVFGVVALFVPGAVMLSLALFFAAYVSIDGVLGIISAVQAARHHRRWGLLLVEAILNLAMGVIAALFPAAAVVAFVLVMAVWALVTGLLMVVAAFHLPPNYGGWWLGLGGVVSFVWGVLLAVAPLIGAVVLTWWLGGYAIAFGVMLLVLAFRLRRHRALGESVSLG
jgi:uncharacterized membrane protein HdeD (DUF308 family)